MSRRDEREDLRLVASEEQGVSLAIFALAALSKALNPYPSLRYNPPLIPTALRFS